MFPTKLKYVLMPPLPRSYRLRAPAIRSDSSGFVCIDTLAVANVKPGSVPPIK